VKPDSPEPVDRPAKQEPPEPLVRPELERLVPPEPRVPVVRRELLARVVRRANLEKREARALRALLE
jgi:hypothetical protein